MKKKPGFSLIEVLITMVLVGILSTLCGAMLIFAYSMFEKVMGNGTASIEYKTFRLRTERIFRNMTKAGPILGKIIEVDDTSNEAERIKFDIEYVNYPYSGNVYKRKYDASKPGGTTTRYKVATGVTDPGTWDNNVGRAVSLYSCVESVKSDGNYRRYLMQMEDAENGNRVVVLYSWKLIGDKFVDVSSSTQDTLFPQNSYESREVLLSDVADFQVTTWLSNFYPNRIRIPKYANISAVRLYVQLGEDSDAQYSNDMIFANKSVYGDLDSFFVDINASNVEAP